MLISIHALREEGDLPLPRALRGTPVFLSTPSARRATTLRISSDKLRGDFYPRPPRGGRLTDFHLSISPDDFYPRPPRGGRRYTQVGNLTKSQFLSTPSARRATAERQDADPPAEISIHALREEGDQYSGYSP